MKVRRICALRRCALYSTKADSRLLWMGRWYDCVVMDEEPDRVAMVSDIRRELGTLRSELRSELRSDLRSELSTLIKEEGETTRRHFNVMVEKVEAAVKIVA